MLGRSVVLRKLVVRYAGCRVLLEGMVSEGLGSEWAREDSGGVDQFQEVGELRGI